jgi:hypothetical protein
MVGQQEHPDLLTFPRLQRPGQTQGVVGALIAIGGIIDDEQGRAHDRSPILQLSRLSTAGHFYWMQRPLIFSVSACRLEQSDRGRRPAH